MKNILNWGVLGVFFFVLTGCDLFFPSKEKNTSQNPSQGYYTIYYPFENQRLKLDTLFNIQWRLGSEISDPYVNIQLYQGDTFVQNIASRAENDGSHSWRVSSSTGSGTYRIRIVSYSDSTQADFSFDFQITSMYNGAYVIQAPVEGFEAKLDSAMTISWTSSGNPGPSIGIWLYKDTLAVTTIVSSTSDDGAHVWSRVSSSLGSGEDYRIKIASTSDPGITAYSKNFSIRSAFQGSFSFTSPTAGDTLQAGSTYDIDWTVTGSPATTVRLEVFNDTNSLSLITSSTTEDGNYSWTVPGGYASSDQYRIKIISAQDGGISSLSETFVIAGVDPDDYEPDNDSTNATSLTFAEEQTHTVNLNDSDWYSIQADSGTNYIVSTTGVRVYTLIYEAGNSSYDAYFSGTGPNLWTPPASGVYYILIYHYSSYYGEYTLSVTPMDSLKVIFTSPTSESVAPAGEILTVQWDTTTSNILGSSVRLALMRDSVQIISLTTSTSNDGELPITIPAGFSSGSNYRIRMQSYSNTDMEVYSDSFSIAGVPRDAFETDDSLEAAKPIAKDGTPQNRTLSYQDEDWARFDAVEGYTYIINIRGDIYVRLYVTDSTGSNLQTQSTINPSLGFNPTADGTYYINVSYYTSSYYGDYSLNLLEVNPDSADDRILVSAPDTGTVWATGTSYTINWDPDSTLLGSRVRLALYKDSVFIQTITSSTANDGEQTWSVSTGLRTGSDYSIRVINYDIQEIYGRSGAFTISGLTPDPLEPDNVRDSATAVTPDGTLYNRSLSTGDQDWMTFTAEAGTHYMATVTGGLRISLTAYEDTAGSPLTTITNTNPILALQDAKAVPYTWRVSGSVGDYQIRFAPFQPDSLVTFTNPITTSVLSAGSNYTITWEPDTTYFKSTVTLYLHKGERLILPLGSATMLSGQRSWNIPAGIASGSDYSIRMGASTLSNVYASSPAFSISGIAADSFEPNDSVAQATSIVPDGSLQTHNLTYQDVDWFGFSATAQTAYQITTAQAATLVPSIVLYSDSGSTQLTSSNASDTTHSLVWFANDTEELQFRISAAARTGGYTVSVQAYEPSAYQFTVTQPTVGSVFTAGDTLNIAWNSLVNLGGNVDIFLFNEAGVVQTIQANRANTGAFTWIVPASLTADTDYYIRIISRISSDINGNSELFTIN